MVQPQPKTVPKPVHAPRPKQQSENRTDQEIEDSFPASDPPSWTGSHATHHDKH